MAVDFHSHILPGIDDGSRSVEESIAMLRASAEQGIREVVLTPHFYPQHTAVERFLHRRTRSMEKLQEAISAEAGLPAVRCGAEVHFYPQMSHSDALRSLVIEGTEHLLVEMPMTRWTPGTYGELEDIYGNLGLTPIIAHLDRYLGRFRDYGIPERLAQLPVMVQINASAVLSGSMGLKLLRQRRAHLLGSDCHNMKERKPNLGAAAERITRKLGKDTMDWIYDKERSILR